MGGDPSCQPLLLLLLLSYWLAGRFHLYHAKCSHLISTDSMKSILQSLSFAHRGIVLASHLKPLERKDKIGGKRTVAWNCHATQRGTSQDETTEISQVGEAQPLQPSRILCPKPPILSSYDTYFILLSHVELTGAGFHLQSQKEKQPADGEGELNWAEQVRKVG